MTHNAETEVENYLLEGHSFEEFATEVARYNALIEEISYDCPKVFLIFFLKYSAILSKIHSYRLLFGRFFPLGKLPLITSVFRHAEYVIGKNINRK